MFLILCLILCFTAILIMWYNVKFARNPQDKNKTRILSTQCYKLVNIIHLRNCLYYRT